MGSGPLLLPRGSDVGPPAFPGVGREKFPPSFVFINIAGCTFIFVKRGTEYGKRDKGHGIRDIRSRNGFLVKGTRPPGFGIINGNSLASSSRPVHLEFSRSFVFINIAGCTFIFVKRGTEYGTRDTGYKVEKWIPGQRHAPARIWNHQWQFPSSSSRSLHLAFQPSFVFINFSGYPFKERIEEPEVWVGAPSATAGFGRWPPYISARWAREISPLLCFHQHHRMPLHFCETGHGKRDTGQRARVRDRGLGAAFSTSIPPLQPQSRVAVHWRLAQSFCPLCRIIGMRLSLERRGTSKRTWRRLTATTLKYINLRY